MIPPGGGCPWPSHMDARSTGALASRSHLLRPQTHCPSLWVRRSSLKTPRSHHTVDGASREDTPSAAHPAGELLAHHNPTPSSTSSPSSTLSQWWPSEPSSGFGDAKLKRAEPWAPSGQTGGDLAVGSDPASSARGPLVLNSRCPRGFWERAQMCASRCQGQETPSGLKAELLVSDACRAGSEGSWAHGAAGQVGPGEFVVRGELGLGSTH